MKYICGLERPTNAIITVDNKQLYKDINFLPSLGIILGTPDGYTGFENLKQLALLN